MFTAEHSSSLFHDDISLAAHAHTHSHVHVLVVSLVHAHALVVSIIVSLVHAHAHVLVVSIVVYLVHANAHVLIHHQASIHKLRSEVESTCRHSEVEDFDPLFTAPRVGKSLQRHLTRSDNWCSISI